MKKKKVSLLGIVLIVIFALFEMSGVDLNTLTTYLNTNDTSNNETENVNNDIELVEVMDSELKVYFLDVGQADCILIQNNNENMLIDAGNNEDGDKIVAYFKSIGITNFKYVIGTHPHEDHIGGLDDIIESFDIETVFMPDSYTTTSTFEDVLDALDKKNMTFTVPTINEKLTLGEAYFEILYTGSNTNDLNDASIVLKLTFGNNSFLFSGDATSSVEKQILDQNLKVDVYKVAHHGSNTSNSDKFLDKVNPTYGIISCGQDNSYGHPHSEIVTSLENRNVKLYRTDKLGTILVVSDGNNISITNFETNTNG